MLSTASLVAAIALATTPPARPASPAAPSGTPTSQPAPARSMLLAGQPAPPLTPHLTSESWLKGTPVAAFEPGKVYVIEFWATWCAPCVAGFAHLTELQRTYRDKGLVIIGMTSRDPRNELTQVKAMVEMRGDGMDYSVAWDGSTAIYRAYMTASRQSSIPAAFVVKDGILEFMGHPSTLDLVLPKLLDGTWDRAKDTASVREAEAMRKVMDMSVRTDPAKAMASFKAIEERWPTYADEFLIVRHELERKLGDAEGAKKTLETYIEQAIELKDVPGLRGVAVRLLPRKAEPGVLDECLRTAAAAVDASSRKDAVSLRILAKVYEARGQQAEAIASMKSAIEVADADTRPRLEDELAKLMSGQAAPRGTSEPDSTEG